MKEKVTEKRLRKGIEALGGLCRKSLALALLLSACATAGTLERTAVVALKDLRRQPHAAEWEYSGVIVYRDGAYRYSGFPHTDYIRDHVQLHIKEQMLPGDKLVAIYHNHPCYSTTLWVQYFSPADLISAKMYDVPTFMLNTCTGEVHEFDWNVDTVRGSGADVPARTLSGEKITRHLPAGRIIGNIGITSPNLDVTSPHGLYPRDLR